MRLAEKWQATPIRQRAMGLIIGGVVLFLAGILLSEGPYRGFMDRLQHANVVFVSWEEVTTCGQARGHNQARLKCAFEPPSTTITLQHKLHIPMKFLGLIALACVGYGAFLWATQDSGSAAEP